MSPVSRTTPRRRFLAWPQLLSAFALAAAGVLGAATASNATTCSYSFHGYSHTYICGTHIQHYSDVAGGERSFLVGTDHHIYNIIKYNSNGSISGWKSLGGWGKSGVWDDFRLGRPLVIRTIGADNDDWCNELHGPPYSWGGWYHNAGCP